MESQVMEFQENSHRGRVSEKNDESSDVNFSKRVILDSEKSFYLPINRVLRLDFCFYGNQFGTITWHSCLISKRITHDHAKSKCTF